MNDIPPKHTVNGNPFASPDAERSAGFNPPPPSGFTDHAPGALVSVHNAAMHANPDSFPVLKAFQDYLEAERNSARRRVVMLSVFFVSLMAVVVAGLISVGLFVFNNMARQQEAAARTQDLLLQTVLQQRAATPFAAPAPDPLAVAVHNLGQKLDTRLTDVGASTANFDKQMAAQNAELDKLKASLAAIQHENLQLRDDAQALRSRPPPQPIATANQPRPPATVNHTPLVAPPRVTDVPPAVTGLPPLPQPPADHTGERSTAPVIAPTPSLPKTPLDLPPDGFQRHTPPAGYTEDVVAIPSRVNKDNIRWRMLTPAK